MRKISHSEGLPPPWVPRRQSKEGEGACRLDGPRGVREEDVGLLGNGDHAMPGDFNLNSSEGAGREVKKSPYKERI